MGFRKLPKSMTFCISECNLTSQSWRSDRYQILENTEKRQLTDIDDDCRRKTNRGRSMIMGSVWKSLATTAHVSFSQEKFFWSWFNVWLNFHLRSFFLLDECCEINRFRIKIAKKVKTAPQTPKIIQVDFGERCKTRWKKFSIRVKRWGKTQKTKFADWIVSYKILFNCCSCCATVSENELFLCCCS
jgi:hypothetical protein